MNYVRFLSRRAAEQLAPPGRCAIISIHDVSEPPAQLQDGWLHRLTLRFHDTDGSQLGLEVFSVEQARSCVDFVNEVKDSCEALYVHCQMGESRSGAVALFFSELLRLQCFKAEHPVDATRHTNYNRKVYRSLFEVVNGPVGTAFEALPSQAE